jgi:hypothetical protein
MRPATERLVESIIQGNDYTETDLAVLLALVQSLVQSKKTTLTQVYTVLQLTYADLWKGQQDTESTHL